MENINPISESQFADADMDAVDREWEEFSKLAEKKKSKKEQSFYPCPAPEDDYLNSLVYNLYSKPRIIKF